MDMTLRAKSVLASSEVIPVYTTRESHKYKTEGGGVSSLSEDQ